MAYKGSNKFDPRKERFLQEIVKDGNATRAAVAAGAPRGSASATGHNLMGDPYIKEALQKVRENSVKMAGFNADEALKQADQAIEFAISSDNANAYVKALELKSKIQGLLVEKIDVRAQVGFTIMMAPLRPQPITEGEVVSVTALPSSTVPQPAPTGPAQGQSDLPMSVVETEENPFEGLDDGDTSPLDDPFSD